MSMSIEDLLREIDSQESKLPDDGDPLGIHEVFEQEVRFLIALVKSEVGLPDAVERTCDEVLKDDYSHPGIGRAFPFEYDGISMTYNIDLDRRERWQNRYAGLKERCFPLLRQRVKLILSAQSADQHRIMPEPESITLDSQIALHHTDGKNGLYFKDGNSWHWHQQPPLIVKIIHHLYTIRTSPDPARMVKQLAESFSKNNSAPPISRSIRALRDLCEKQGQKQILIQTADSKWALNVQLNCCDTLRHKLTSLTDQLTES